MKNLILLLFGLFLTLSATSQISLGPKVGYLTNELSIVETDIKSSLNESLLFGAFARLGGKVYLQPEVNWFTSGAVFTRPSLGSISPIEQEVTLNTIQIPLMIGFKLIDLKLASLRAIAGPSANIVIDKTISTNTSAGFINPIKEADIQNVNWGFQAGGGIDILMFTLDVRYFIGLSNIIGNVNVGGGSSLQFDSRNEGFMVSLGWKII